MRTIIGVTGEKRGGEDTIATRLVQEHGYIRFAFADKIKSMMLQLDPIITSGNFTYEASWTDEEVTYGAPAHLSKILSLGIPEDEAKDRFPEYRRLLQIFGTEVMREQDPDYRINVVLKQIAALPEDAKIVVSDVRFPNEAECLRQLAGARVELWNVSRPSLDDSEAPATHASEAHAGNLGEDLFFVNDTSVQDLQDLVSLHARLLEETEDLYMKYGKSLTPDNERWSDCPNLNSRWIGDLTPEAEAQLQRIGLIS